MKYYVYELINSINGTPFYIGKGSGRRMYIHENRAKYPYALPNENKKLRNKIKSILNNGGKVIYNRIFFTDDAKEAYMRETERIQELGLQNLCNRFIFPPTTDEIYKLIAMKKLGYKTPEETKKKISKSLLGHSVSAETRQKISLGKSRKQQPCSEKRKAAIAASKKPVGGFPPVIAPDGKLYTIDILSDFCREHNLSISAMCGLFKHYKGAKSHRGWRLADV